MNSKKSVSAKKASVEQRLSTLEARVRLLEEAMNRTEEDVEEGACEKHGLVGCWVCSAIYP